jgi:hypothetical protein
MPEQTELTNKELFAKWLDNQLSKQERLIFEKRCIDDPDFSAKVETANRVAFDAQNAESFAPPAWDKSQTIAFSRAPQNTSWHWLPMSSMAMSLLAIVLVVSGFQVRTNDSNLQMGFNLSPSTQDIATLIDDKIADYQATNQTLMAQYIDALQTQNTQSRTELTRFVLETSREERREDFADLIKFINEQRDDDQRFYARQLNKLESEFYSGSLQE